MTSLEGEYIPSTLGWVKDQIDTYERTGGKEASTLRDTGIPVIVVTMRGAKSGAVRKIALMRVEHEGAYALVASRGGAPHNPDWYTNLVSLPDEVLLQDGPSRTPYPSGRSRVPSVASGGSARSRCSPPTPSTRRRRAARSR